MKYKVIIIEDKDKDWINFLCNLLMKLNIIRSNIFISYTQAEALKVISEHKIDISFVDITLPIQSSQSPEVINAGLVIIQQIAEYDIKGDRYSLIFLFSNNINDPEVDGYKEIIRQYTDHRIILIPKFDLHSANAKPRLEKYILEEIFEFLLSRIRQINNAAQWCKLLSSISNKNYSEKINFNGSEWEISDFLFPEIEMGNLKFFGREKLVAEIQKLVSFPKNKLWGNRDSWGKLTRTYFKFIELDEKRGFEKLFAIESLAKDYIFNFIELLIAIDNKQPTESFSNRAKNHQLRSHQCKETDIPDVINIFKISDIPDEFFDNLLIRYIVLTLRLIAEKANKQNWINTRTIVELFDHYKPNDDTVKNFYYYTGFNRNRDSSLKHSSYTIDIFYTEMNFLKVFDFHSLLKRITPNNQNNPK